MKRLTIVDIRNRLRFRLEGAEDLSTRDRYERLAETAINSGYPSQIVTVLEYGIIDNDRLSLDTMCCLFDALSECGTESQIRKYGNIILKEYVSKVRDAKETQTYLKRKLGNAKSKLTTKVQNNFDDIKDAFNKMVQSAQGNFKSNVASMKKTADKVFPNSPLKKKEEKEKAKKEAAWIEAYENMLEEATKLVSIDRILENYNRISKRFNIDRIIQENTVINGVVDTVIELCNLIDTYDMPVKARYNTCLETCWYGFHKNSFEFNESELVTAVTDYYMAHGKNGKACAGILEASTVFDKDDYMGDMEVLTEEEPEDDIDQYSEALMDSKMVEFNTNTWQQNSNNILYITGVSASGKSTLGRKLASERNAQYISLDHYTSLASKGPARLKDAMHDGTMEDIGILSKFFTKYPKEFIGKDVSEKEKKDHFLFFFNWLDSTLSGDGHLYIVEGIHLFMYTDPSFYKNKPIICMTTSTVVSFCRRFSRGYDRRLDAGDSTIKALTYIFADAIKNGIPMYMSHSKQANTFTIGVSKNNVEITEGTLMEVLTEEEPEDESTMLESNGFYKVKGLSISKPRDPKRKYDDAIVDFAIFCRNLCNKYKKEISNGNGMKPEIVDVYGNTTYGGYVPVNMFYSRPLEYAESRMDDTVELFEKLEDCDELKNHPLFKGLEQGGGDCHTGSIIFNVKGKSAFDRFFGKESAIFHEIEFKNDKGEEVPKVCPKCGSKVGVFLKGEPVFLCSNKDCEKYFGTVPFTEAKLSAADRAKIKDSDYGIPSKRKYPMPDESHVRSAIQMFNHVDKEDEAELARNIKKKIKKYGMSVDVGKDNRFSKYYEAAEETGIIRSEIREAVTGNTGYTYFSEDVDFNKILNDFKASNDEKKESKLKALVTKLYSKDVENIVEGTPNLLSYIRTIFILGTFAIPVVGPIVGIITFIADRFIALHMDRKNTEKMRQAFQAEIRATNKKLESTTNEETKGRLEEYKKALTDAYDKIDKYYEDLLSDEELDKKYDEDDDSDIKGGAFGDFGDDFGDDFDFDDDEDFDFDDMEDFEEAVRFIPLTMKIAESFDMTCPVKQFDQEKCHKMLNTAPSLVKDLGDVSIKFPNIIDPDELRRAIDDTRSDAQIGNVKINMVERYDMQNMYKDLSNIFIKESKASDIFTEARSLAVQTEIVRALNEVYSACVYYSPITEASFTNSLKLASEKIKKAFTKMSDKEKEISKNIDVSVNNVKKSAERALEADNREAVIKGSVLPSASKLIKLTIVNAALGILINPAIAVISTLGYLAVSKATKEKQRRAILDEIEIELKMCNKYIDLAESKNDLKALKKLYTIQRNLERQRAKIKFNLQVKGEKYHDPGDFDQHGVEG